MKHIQYVLREHTAEDMPFIFNSWLKSYKANSACKLVPDVLYFKSHTKIINFLLSKSIVLIACFPEDPTEIIGYVVYQIVSDIVVIHWIYVKDKHRYKYNATDIIKQICKPEDKLIICTYIVNDFNKFKHKLNNIKVVYDPYYILETMNERS